MCGTMTASMRCGKCLKLVSGEYGADELKCPCGACVISFKTRPAANATSRSAGRTSRGTTSGSARVTARGARR